MPPATTTSASPARISAAASMIALRPEPQTRLIVVALRRVRRDRPASAAWRAGAWPAPGLEDLAHEDLVDRRRRRARPARSTAARMATPPSSIAGTPASAPPNLPIGVRAALTM